MDEDKLIEVEELFKKVSFLQMKKSFSYFKKLGIYPGQEIIIKLIVENPGITGKELVEITDREKATITKALQRLEKGNFIKRQIDEKDKRVFKFFVTDLGFEVNQNYKKIKEEQLNFYRKILNKKEIEDISNVLHKLYMELK